MSKNLQRWLRSRNGIVAIAVMLVLVVALGVWFGTRPSPGTVLPPEPETWGTPAGGYSCLPSCSESDGLFFSHVGLNTASFAADDITLWIGVPAHYTSLEIGFFDGDSSKNSAGVVAKSLTHGHWDTTTTESVYTLYADPLKDGSGTTVVGSWRGNVDMLDNAWFNVTINQISTAKSPSGHYGYRLVVTRAAEGSGVNAFKVRSTGYLSTGQSDLVDASFALVGGLATWNDVQILYPQWSGSGTNYGPSLYSGEWNIPFYVGNDLAILEIWDGDFDHGSWDRSALDTDDRVTGTGFIPQWAVNTVGVRPQGAQGVGAPPDNNRSVLYSRQPAVVYRIIDPNGDPVYVNPNPSGTEEWQKFVVSTNPADMTADQAHIVTSRIQPGVYYMHIVGLDLHNTVWVRITQEVPGLCTDGTPCVPPPVWPEAACPRTIGYWKNNVQKVLIQNRNQGVQESRVTLEWGLNNVAAASPLFRSGINTTNPVAINTVARLTDAEANTILQRQSDNSMMARALQQNLATWLNLGTGKIGPTTVITLNGIKGGPFNGTVMEALQEAQAIILNSNRTADDLERAKDIADMINNRQINLDPEPNELACTDYVQVIPPAKQPPAKKDTPKAPKPPTPANPIPEPEPNPATCPNKHVNNYTVEITDNPFYSVKFNYQSGTEVKNGGVEEFKFTVTAEQLTQMTSQGIQLEAKAGTVQGLTSMNNCDFASPFGCGEVAKDSDINFVFQFADTTDNGDGTFTLRFWLFNNASSGLSHASFGLPAGVVPSTPTNTYQSEVCQ
jgi:hypothetical protein